MGFQRAEMRERRHNSRPRAPRRPRFLFRRDESTLPRRAASLPLPCCCAVFLVAVPFLECLAAPPFVQCPAAPPSVPPWGGGGRAGWENRRPTPIVEELSCVSPYPSTSFTAPVMQIAAKIFFCFSAQRAWMLINPPQLSSKMQNIMQAHV